MGLATTFRALALLGGVGGGAGVRAAAAFFLEADFFATARFAGFLPAVALAEAAFFAGLRAAFFTAFFVVFLADFLAVALTADFFLAFFAGFLRAMDKILSGFLDSLALSNVISIGYAERG